MTFPEAVPNGPADVDASSAVPGTPGERALNAVPFLAAVLAAIGAGLSGQTPTGTSWWDNILAVGLAVIFVLSAGRAGRVPVLIAAGIAATFVGPTPWLIVAVLGFVCGVAAALTPSWSKDLQAVSAALTIVALLHLPAVGFFGFPSVLAASAVLGVLLSAYRATGRIARRRARWAAIVLALLVSFFLIIAGFMALSIRSTANEGVSAARRGLDAARAGDTRELTRQLEQAKTQLSEANDQINSPLLKPLRLLPVAAQNVRSLSTATAQGVVIANEAASTAQDANIEDLQLRQGQLDLDLLASMAPRLQTTVQQLEQAVRLIEADDSPWLLPAVTRQLDSLVGEVIEVLPETRVAADAARVMPAMLGVESERRYLMLFGSPGEAREFGGFIGGYALIGISNGNLDLVQAGSINDLVPLANQGQLSNPDSYPIEFVAAEPALYPQNLTSTPNLDVVARAARDIFPTIAGAPIDGVIYADPFALAAMTEFTGPIAVDGIAEPLDRQGLLDLIFVDQYEETRQERFGTFGAIATATAGKFATADLPGPERLGEVLGPVARAGRLQIISYDQAENDFLASVKLQRQFVAPTNVDSFAVIHTNGTQSKLDLYLHREITYDITVEPDGSLFAVVDVELRSDIAADAPPLTFGATDGTNQVLLSLYSRHELANLTVGGEQHEYVVQEEFGFFRYALFKVAVPPNETVSVSFELTGVSPEVPYRAGIWEQPLVNNDIVTVTYRTPGTAPVTAQREMVESWLFDPDELSVPG